MKRNLLLAMAILLVPFGMAFGQISAYKYAVSTGTYTALSGGTVLGNSTTDDQRFVDPASPLGGTTTAGPGFPIGFNFVFGGATFDKVGVNANGWITLGSSTVSVPASSSPISGTATQVLSPFARDLVARAGAEIRIQTIGTTPNQQLVVQWTNYKRYTATAGGFDTDTINFQVILNETSNTAQFVYGKIKTAATLLGDVIVGLKGTSTTNYITLDGSFSALVKGTATTSNVDFNSTSAPSVGQAITFSAPTCFLPTALAATGLTPNSANLSWTTGGATSWNVQYGTSGFTLGTGTKVNVLTTPSTTITGLSQGTVYQFYVRDSCAIGDVSNWVGPVSFTTPCFPIAVFPYTQDFEGATTGAPGVQPSCWSITNASTYRWEVDVNGTTSSNTGPTVDHTLGTSVGKYVYVEASNGTAGALAYLNLPAFDVTTLTAPQLEFYYHMYGSQVTGLWLEAYNSVAAKWDTIYSIIGQQQTSGAAPWLRTTVGLSAVSSANLQLRFVSRKGTGTLDFEGDVALDDVTIRETPSCAAPTVLGAFGITSTSANLFWTTGGAANWNVEYGVTGFSLGSGTRMNFTNDTVSISGLNSQTTYQFYVRDSCGIGSTSAWAGPFSFTTLCGVFPAPFLQTFTGTTTPLCWSQSATTGGPWIFTGTPDFGNTFAMLDHTNGVTNNYAWVDQSGTDAGVIIESPEINVASLTTPFLSYWVVSHNNTTSVTVFNILFAEAWNGSSWVKVDSVQGDFGLQWVEFTANLTPYVYNTNLVKVRFRVESGGDVNDFDNDILLDDVSVAEGPTCFKPTALGAFNITTTTANIYWTTGGASNWRVEYGPTGFTPGTGTNVIAANDTIAITGLTANTTYQFYVKDSCSATDVSAFAGPFSFSTPCNVATLPFLETWESTSPTVSCWSAQTNWAISNTASAYGQGSNSVMFPFYNITSGTFDAFSPDFTPVPTGYRLSFDHAYATVATEVDSIKIYYSTNGGSSYSLLVGLDGGPNGALTTAPVTGFVFFVPTATQWDSYSIGLPAGTNKLKITAVSAFGNNVYLDNIAVELAPLCPVPTALGANNITSSSADVYWTTGGSAQWNVEYGITGFTQGAGTLVSLATNDTVSLTGLTAQTCYDFYVQDVCTSDSSLWVGPYNFCTPGVSTACNVPNTLQNDTVCSPGVSRYASTVGNEVVVFNTNNRVSLTTDTVSLNVIATTSAVMAEVTPGLLSGNVGPLTSIAALGFGNFTNGQWFTALDTIRIDSMTVRSNGVVTANLQILTNDPGLGGTLIQSGKTFTTGTATADYQVEVGVVLVPGSYYMNVSFTGGTGMLFRATGGAVYPYVLPGLMSIDSTNFAGPRIYYTFDMVVSEMCMSPKKTVTTYLIGQNPGLGRSVVICDNAAAVNLTTYLSPTADAGGTFISPTASAAISGNTFNPALASPGRHKVFYQTLGTSSCPADSSEFMFVVQNCSGCATLTAPTLTADTTCGPGFVTLSGNTSATGIIWYNSADSILSYDNDLNDSIAINTTYKAQSVFSAGPGLKVGPPVTVNQNTYPASNFTNGQFISAAGTVRIDSATFAVNGPLDFVVVVYNPQRTVLEYVSKVISFSGADTAQKEIGIVLPAGQYFMGIASVAGTGILWRMTAGGAFPYGAPGFFTVDSSDFGPARYYYFHDMIVSSACVSPTVTVTGVVAPGFNAGTDANTNVCDTLKVDLTNYLGTFDPGGNWVDVSGTGALTGSIFTAYQVAKNASYTFRYEGGVGDCGDTATITLFVDYCSIWLKEYVGSGVEVYPNPTKGNVFVEDKGKNSQLMTLELYSLNGQLLYRKAVAGNQKAEVEVQGLSDGIYNLRVITDEGVSVHRIVKQ